MKALLVLSLLSMSAISLTACEQIEANRAAREQRQLTADDTKCANYGLVKGSSDYAQCRMMTEQQRLASSPKTCQTRSHLGITTTTCN